MPGVKVYGDHEIGCICEQGWVCEAHPDKPLEHDDCTFPGVLCDNPECPWWQDIKKLVAESGAECAKHLLPSEYEHLNAHGFVFCHVDKIILLINDEGNIEVLERRLERNRFGWDHDA
jgi:hypothetical protein